MARFAHLRPLGDADLLAALGRLFAPGQPEPELRALCAALRGRSLAVPVPGGTVSVELGDWTSILLIRLGGWEPHLAALARALVVPGELAVDAGAHVGTWTLLLASLVGETGRVVAYEPDPDNARRARAAVTASGLGGRAHVHQAALGESSGWARLYRYASGERFPGADAMLRSLVLADGYADQASSVVQVTTLDAADLDRVDFLKIDTEGLELAVLRGARSTLAKSPGARLLVELHPEELAAQRLSVADVFRELSSQGFTVFDLCPEGATLVARPLTGLPATHHVLARRRSTPFEVSLMCC